VTFNLKVADFAFVEEARDLGFGGFRAVGSVADVAHFGVFGFLAKVAADRAGGSFFGVCWSEQVTDTGDDVVSAEGESHDRSLLHETADRGEERHLGDVGVVLGENLVRKRHHLDATDFESLGLVAGEDGADEVLFDRIGLKENKRGFLCHDDAELSEGQARVNSVSDWTEESKTKNDL
jgi:hypothetical protein